MGANRGGAVEGQYGGGGMGAGCAHQELTLRQHVGSRAFARSQAANQDVVKALAACERAKALDPTCWRKVSSWWVRPAPMPLCSGHSRPPHNEAGPRAAAAW